MELIRRQIHMSSRKAKAVWQMTLNDDFQAAEGQPDVGQLTLWQENLELESVRAEEGKVRLQGSLHFSVFYGAENAGYRPGSIRGKIPFDEQVHMEGLESNDEVQVKRMVEDFQVSRVHARKIAVRALITFELWAKDISEAQLTVGAEPEPGMETSSMPLSLAALAARKRDTCRIRDEVMIPMNQPNIREIIWQECALRGIDVRLGEEKIFLKGELQIFVLYRGEDDEEKTRWVSQNIPFRTQIDCPGCQEQMVGHVETVILHGEAEARPDYDGEMRILSVEAVLDVNARIYTEEHMSLLQDLFCAEKDLEIVRTPVFCQKLLVNNMSRCRVLDRLNVPDQEKRILQICQPFGEVRIDDVMTAEQGLEIEGVLQVQVLCITEDDRDPFICLRGVLPFEYLLEVPDMCTDAVYHLSASLEQLTAAMTGSTETEVKGAVLLNALVLAPLEVSDIAEVREHPQDPAAIQALPGLLIYTVQPGDTVWSIAKAWHTTPEKLRSCNNLSAPELQTGQKLLVIKQVETFSCTGK